MESGRILREEEMRMRRSKKQSQTIIPLKNLKMNPIDNEKAQ